MTIELSEEDRERVRGWLNKLQWWIANRTTYNFLEIKAYLKELIETV